MAELCAPLLPALLAGVFGFAFFVWGKARPHVYPGRSGVFPGAGGAEARKLPEPLLRELVREAEERMKAQEDAFRFHERKAALLATLCIVMLGHLLSGLGGDSPFSVYRDWPAMLWPAAAILLLAVSASLCMRAIDFAAYTPPGFPPYVGGRVLANAAPDGKDGALEYLLFHLLEEYDKRIENNETKANERYRRVFYARWFWLGGASAYLGMLGGGSEILNTCARLAG